LSGGVRELDGIRAELHGYVQYAPRARYQPTGECVWEFGVRLIDTLTVTTETIVIRLPDQHCAQLQRWAVPGRQAYVRGALHVARWRANDGREPVRLLLEATELMPLDARAPGSASAALHFSTVAIGANTSKVTVATVGSVLKRVSTASERTAQVLRLLDEG
jgi:hypothetical protein